MDWLFELDSAYVDFLAKAYAALLVALSLYMPLFGFLFHLGWLFAGFLVSAIKDMCKMFSRCWWTESGSSYERSM